MLKILLKKLYFQGKCYIIKADLKSKEIQVDK